MGILFLKLMLVEYVVAMILFAWGKDWPRALYFLGAAVLSVGVLTMK